MSNTPKLTLEKYSSEAKSVIKKSQLLADKNNHKVVEPIHCLAIVLELDDASKLLEMANLDPKVIRSMVESQLQELPKSQGQQSYLSDMMLGFLTRAENLANNKDVSLEHLVFALLDEKKGSLMRILQHFGLNSSSELKTRIAAKDPVKKPESYLNDLTDLAKSDRLDPVIGRSLEVRRLIQILGRRHKSHPILVGEVGVGKRSIVNALAQKIASGAVSDKFSKLSIVQLDAGRLTSGVKQRGEVEERMRKAISSLKPESTILFIHSIESLFGQNTIFSGAGDLVSSLLAQENLRLVVSTTTEGLRKLTEKDANLARQFTQISVEPSTEQESIEILRGIAPKYEAFHHVQIGDPAITSAVKLAKRYLQKRALPDSAIDLLDEASSRKKFEIDGLPSKSDTILSRYSSLKAQMRGLMGDEDPASLKSKSLIETEVNSLSSTVQDIYQMIRHRRPCKSECVLTEEDIAAVLEDWTGIPLSKMLEGESAKLGKMEDILAGKVVGQDEAIRAVSKAIRRSRLGLRDLGKPIGSFLFLGSSGCGKTEMSKATAKFLFDDEKAMVRFDMSEFQQSHMIQRLIGAPPGYAQAESGGALTEAVAKNPYCVLLFDEVEKAHPDIFNILLQVLDDGRLTDGLGKTVDFSNTVVILTTNIGSPKILDTAPEQFASEEGILALKAELQSDLRGHLRPEFLNRLDEIIVFRPLDKTMLKSIADIQFSILEKLLSPREIKVSVSDEAKEWLVEQDFNPGYGARPLKRAILKNVQDVLAERIMAAEIKDRSTVNISVKANRLQFQEAIKTG